MDKNIVFGAIFFLMICLVGITGYYLLTSQITHPAIPEMPKDPEDIILQPKYQVFQPGLGNKEIIDSIYLRPQDTLPKSIKLGSAELIVKEINLDKNPINDGFSAYVLVSHNNKDQKIGFWHPSDPTKEGFLKTNACTKGENTYDYVCGGILVVEIKDWNRAPTEEEKSQGIINVFYLERVFLQELDYDFATHKWNYVKIALGLYEEKQYPPKIEDRDK